MIKEYIEAKYGFKVHIAYIVEVKRVLVCRFTMPQCSRGNETAEEVSNSKENRSNQRCFKTF